MKILRRVLWNIYAVPMPLMLFFPEAFVVFHYRNPLVIPFATLDFCISLPGVIAMNLHIWDEQLFHPLFWKIYAFVCVTWDVCFNILIEPRITDVPLGSDAVVGFVIMIPLYVAIFRYAFRKWDNN